MSDFIERERARERERQRQRQRESVNYMKRDSKIKRKVKTTKK